ncbi:unnamed protein product, partial [Mesorhabditis spiculigera]
MSQRSPPRQKPKKNPDVSKPVQTPIPVGKPSMPTKSSNALPYSIAGTVITVLIAASLQYAYQKYYLNPKTERTLLPNLAQKYEENWRPLEPDDIFSLRTARPDSYKFGVGWYDNVEKKVFTTVNDVGSATWTMSDGRTFGVEKVTNGNVTVEFQWVNTQRTWTTRINFKNADVVDRQRYAIFVYFKDDGKTTIGATSEKLLNGNSEQYGNFTLSADLWGDEGNFTVATIHDANPASLGAIFASEFSPKHNAHNPVKVFTFNVTDDIYWEFAFSTSREKPYTGEGFYLELNTRIADFKKNFEDKFKFSGKTLPEFYVELSRAAVSNLLASDRYFDGSLKVAGTYNTELIEPWLNLINEQSAMISEVSNNQIVLEALTGPQIFYALDQLLTDETIHSQKAFFKRYYPRLEAHAKNLLQRLDPNGAGRYSWPLQAKSSLFEATKKHKGFHVDAQIWAYYLAKSMSKLSAHFAATEESGYWKNAQLVATEKLQEFKNGNRYCDFEALTTQERQQKFNYYNCQTAKAVLPILLGITNSSHDEFDDLLKELADSKWLSRAGIRDSADGDLIQIATNYFFLKTAYEHIHESGPHQSDAHQLYGQLRMNLISTVAVEYQKSGNLIAAFHENGDPYKTKSTAATSLLALILSEKY